MFLDVQPDYVSNLRGWAAAQPFKGSIEPLRLET